MGPYRSENGKTLLLLQIAIKSFRTSPKGRYKTRLEFEILSFRFLTIFFEIFKFAIAAYGEMKSLNNLINERS